MSASPRFPGIRITTNGNQLVAWHTEARITDGGVFYPITPSTEMGESYQLAQAEGRLNVFGRPKIAIEAEGEHAAQGGAIALSVCGKRTVNFTSGQGLVYALEQYFHAPGKLSTLVVEVAARALTRHALNVHCGHDDVYACLDTGWIMLFGKDAQQAADQALILRKVAERALVPGINIQDGFLTSHLERTFRRAEAELLREFLGSPDDEIACPTPAQQALFGPVRRRVPRMIDLENPALLGPVQNQEHYMNGVVAHRNHFVEPVLGFLEAAYEEFAVLTGRRYGLLSQYRTDDATTVFVSLGSAAENIEAAVDHLRARGERVGSIHVNVLRPFPESALVEALRGKRTVIVLERTDEPMSGSNPLLRDIRSALEKAHQVQLHPVRGDRPEFLPPVGDDELPRLFGGVYGLGSRDFRPEGILGAYEFATGRIARADGRTAADGTDFFVIGVAHPYAVVSAHRPSLLPEGAIAVRFHSIGGWGMITTGKNLVEIIGELGDWVARRDGAIEPDGSVREVLHVSANPKYGSEKKGAPTGYSIVVARERVRTNCDLHHVNVVLCCDPKAFTHANPLAGIEPGGAFVWECDAEPEEAWRRIPPARRREIAARNLRVFIVPGFEIARNATSQPELQLRMQGNSFLGAFFRVSTFLADNRIDQAHFQDVVRKQYEKKFGRLGPDVVASNMNGMLAGFERVREVPRGAPDAPDQSSLRDAPLLPLDPCRACHQSEVPAGVPSTAVSCTGGTRAPVFEIAGYNAEFRAGLGYDQPASVLSSVGIIPAATGRTASKYVARRETPVFVAENCTQCMKCIAACPDTALPNTAQEIGTILATAIGRYVTDRDDRERMLESLPAVEPRIRASLLAAVAAHDAPAFATVAIRELESVEASADSRSRLSAILGTLPLAYAKANPVFSTVERKSPGHGGLYSIFVSDLCKGCGECVVECGEHEALRMVPETPELNARHATATAFLGLLPETPAKYLGLYDDGSPQTSKEAALRNHLMVRKNYEALVAGDGACAGCGEKSVLRAVASITEAYMRPLYHRMADRLTTLAERLESRGLARLAALAERDPAAARRFHRLVGQVVLGLGGEDDRDTAGRLAARGVIPADEIVRALAGSLRHVAFSRRHLRAVEGRLANGMAVMAMGACTGCNTVFGSTPPNNPHPYPWMNSLFQDGATITWLFGESFIADHARHAVVPERLATALLDRDDDVVSDEDAFRFTHLTDAFMTDREIAELPKAWAIGGDGGMGDIGFQNVSKVVLQNRPNVKLLMLDTQVYSNTGGQNSDSSPMPGGIDMNRMGAATEGKLVEKKGVAEALMSGHGSPFVAQVSMANPAKLYRTLLDALEYRGTAFLQCFTSCQPEHGIGDDSSTTQAQRVRDARVMPEFTFSPWKGETFQDALDLRGNPSPERDWWETVLAATGERYLYTAAHYAATEARFRQHFRAIDEARAAALVPLADVLARVTQKDVQARRHLDPAHPAFVPDFGSFIKAEGEDGRIRLLALSRHMVLFCIERRKAWRLLQSRAGIRNPDYEAQKAGDRRNPSARPAPARS